MTVGAEPSLRRQLADLLTSGAAHLTLEAALESLPAGDRHRRPEHDPDSGGMHTVWELLEHLQIAQWDILEFSRDARHVSPDWPAGYWPPPGAVCGEAEWQATLYALETDREAFRELILDPSRNLHEPFPWGDGQTLLREALLLADHNAYHLGQIVDVRRALGCWPPGEPRLDEG